MFSDSFSVLTYNLEFNKALDVIPKIIQKYSPDIICLQEVAVDKTKFRDFTLPGYSLAGASGSFYRVGRTYGQATFYKKERFVLAESKSIMLPKAYYEVFITLLTGKGPRTALCSDLITKGLRQRRLSIYNLHLTALTATNRARQKQLCETMEHIDVDPEQNSVVAGDFNYPFRKKSLEHIMKRYCLSEATSNITYTQRVLFLWWLIPKKYRFLKFDFILHTKSIVCEETLRIEDFGNISDHFPVLSRFVFH